MDKTSMRAAGKEIMHNTFIQTNGVRMRIPLSPKTVNVEIES
jgi:hypothetical protein